MKPIDTKNLTSMRGGYTLVEFIVATGLFVVIIAIVSSIFVQSMRTQRMLNALMEVQSNASLSIEQIMREVRTGYSFSASSIAGSSCDSVGLYDLLTFVRSVRNTTSSITYQWDGSSIIRGEQFGSGDPVTSTLNASSVSVNRLCFALNNNSLAPSGATSTPWRVTLFMNVGPSDSRMKDRTMDIETTVSARTLPKELGSGSAAAQGPILLQ